MHYRPNLLTWKERPGNIVEICSDGKPIVQVDMNNPVWDISAKKESDAQYMQAIKLLGNAKEIKGISVTYVNKVGVFPHFRSLKTTDGTTFFYKGEFDDGFCMNETERRCGDLIYRPRFFSYEHMRGLIITKYDGYQVFDKKSGFITLYNEKDNAIVEQIGSHKLKINKYANSKYTNFKDVEYAIVKEFSDMQTCITDGNISIYRLKPQNAVMYDKDGRQLAQFKFHKNGNLEECYQIDKNGKRKNYHHYSVSGKEDTFLFLLKRKLSKIKTF